MSENGCLRVICMPIIKQHIMETEHSPRMYPVHGQLFVQTTPSPCDSSSVRTKQFSRLIKSNQHLLRLGRRLFLHLFNDAGLSRNQYCHTLTATLATCGSTRSQALSCFLLKKKKNITYGQFPFGAWQQPNRFDRLLVKHRRQIGGV